jgi:hypothetical protein
MIVLFWNDMDILPFPNSRFVLQFLFLFCFPSLYFLLPSISLPTISLTFYVFSAGLFYFFVVFDYFVIYLCWLLFLAFRLFYFRENKKPITYCLYSCLTITKNKLKLRTTLAPIVEGDMLCF